MVPTTRPQCHEISYSCVAPNPSTYHPNPAKCAQHHPSSGIYRDSCRGPIGSRCTPQCEWGAAGEDRSIAARHAILSWMHCSGTPERHRCIAARRGEVLHRRQDQMITHGPVQDKHQADSPEPAKGNHRELPPKGGTGHCCSARVPALSLPVETWNRSTLSGNNRRKRRHAGGGAAINREKSYTGVSCATRYPRVCNPTQGKWPASLRVRHTFPTWLKVIYPDL